MISVSSSRLASGVWAGLQSLLDFAIAVALLLSGPPAAQAQSIFASLSGTVTDSSGAAVPDAKVSVENADTKVIRRFVTNSSGFFSATNLSTGTYNVSVEAKEFQKWQGTGIVLNASDVRSLTIPLKIGDRNRDCHRHCQLRPDRDRRLRGKVPKPSAPKTWRNSL